MSRLTELADALEFHGRYGTETQYGAQLRKIKECAEAAALLRAADGQDVAGLMAMIDAHGSFRWENAYAERSNDYDEAKLADEHSTILRTKLEAALKLAMAPKVDYAKLRDAAEFAAHKLEGSRVWNGMDWHYNPMHPIQYRPALDRLREALKAAPKEPQ